MHTAQASGSRKRWNLEGLWSLAGKRHVVWTRSRSSCNSTDWLLVSLFVSPLPSVPIHSFVPFMITSSVLTHPTRLHTVHRPLNSSSDRSGTDQEAGPIRCHLPCHTENSHYGIRTKNTLPPRSAKQKSQNGLNSLSRSLSQHPASTQKPLQ